MHGRPESWYSWRHRFGAPGGGRVPGRRPRPARLRRESPALPAWPTEDDIQAYAEDFVLHGERAFTGAFDWCRNIERNNELLAPFIHVDLEGEGTGGVPDAERCARWRCWGDLAT
jgi:hypothetical protein